MNVLSLFTGIGGIDLGLQRAGMTIVGQVEIDPWCRRVLAKHWPEVPRHDDVRTFAKWWYAGGPRSYVDLLAGGFPCQPVSLAGKRLGAEDPRWLWPAFAQGVRAFRPRYVLLENVPAVRSRGGDSVFADLAACGYDVQWDCLPASAFGAHHQRDRWFAVAYPGHGPESTRSRAKGWSTREWSTERPEPRSDGAVMADDDGAGRRARGGMGGAGAPFIGDGRWPAEPDVGRSSDGISPGLDGGRLGASAEEDGPDSSLPKLRIADDPPYVWQSIGGPSAVSTSNLLQSNVHGTSLCQRHVAARLEAEEGYTIPWTSLRSLWGYGESSRTSYRREFEQQLTGQYPDLMRILSRYASPPCTACWADSSWEDGLPRLMRGAARMDRLRGLGNAVVPVVAEYVGRLIMARDAGNP